MYTTTPNNNHEPITEAEKVFTTRALIIVNALFLLILTLFLVC